MAQVTGGGTAIGGLGGAAGYGETMLARADEASVRLDLSAVFETGFTIAGVTYPATDIYLGTDGILSFGAPVTGLPKDPASLNLPFIAPFLADIDTRLDGEGAESGPIWLDVDAASDVVTITWQDVGFYRRNASLTNTFQLQLFDQGGGNVDVVLRYQSIEWTSADLEGGWGGLGGEAAFLGLRLEAAGAVTTLDASRNEAAQLALPATVGNTGVAGLYVYHFGPGVVPPSSDQADTVEGGAGDDSLAGLGGNDVLIGAAGADTLDGGAGFDLASYATAQGVTADLAQSGRNQGEAAGDVYLGIEGVTGSDLGDDLGGDGAANLLDGAGGHDVLAGRGGADTLTGGGGDDTLQGGGGADRIEGGAGFDWASYADATAGIRLDLATPSQNTGDAAGDSLTGIEAVLGTELADDLRGDAAANLLDGAGGNDTLTGRAGDDTLTGASGDDLLEGGTGADRLSGGDGFDIASYSAAATGLRADLANAASNTGEAAGDSYAQIEGLTGSGFDDTLSGNAAANALSGGAGNDLLAGRDGADSLSGGAGNDTLTGGAGADQIDGGEGVDWAGYDGATAPVLVDLAQPATNSGEAAGDTFTSIEALIGSALNDSLRGDAGANGLDGGAGDDLLSGRDGADTLSGGAGHDTLQGGLGADALWGGDGFDTASYAEAATALRVDLAAPSANSGEAAGDSFAAIEGVQGGALADALLGDAGANLLGGGAGHDTLTGREGDDTLSGQDGNDSLLGDGGNDALSGGAGNDTLLGGLGADVLEGGLGADSLTGGDGADWASYQAATAGVRVDLTTPTQNTGEAAGDKFTTIEGLRGSAFADDLRGGTGADNLDGGGGSDILDGRAGNDWIAGGDGDDRLTGGVGADTLLGGTGSDILIGGAGADRLDGGDGTDIATYSAATAGVAADLAGLTAGKGDAAGDSFAGVEGLIGTAKNDTLAGDDAANSLDGGAGADTINGRGGADVLWGGAGNDTLDGGAGADLLYGGTEVDRMNGGDGDDVLDAGAGNDTLTGGAGSDTLIGGAGNDTLDGGAGLDWLFGGDGFDLISFASAASGLRIDLANPSQNTGDAAGDIIQGVEALIGSAHADTLLGDMAGNLLDGSGGNDALSGGAGNDTLLGGLGADVLEGGLGADSLTGGDGADWASYQAATAGVRVDLTTPTQNTGEAAGDKFTTIEGLRGSAFADDLRGGTGADNLDGGGGSDILDGRAGNDWIAGGDGDDRLTGGVGADTLLGGTGSDILIGGAGADRLDGGDGTDIATYSAATAGVAADLAGLTAGKGDAAGDSFAGVEGLIGTAKNDTLAGDDAANSLDGGAGADTINGRGGADVLWGGAGNDTLDGGAGADLLYGGTEVDRMNGGDGDDVLDAGAGNDTLTGGAGSDTLIGGVGNDSLDGGLSHDVLTGGQGADSFGHSGFAIDGTDWVTDFSAAEKDFLLFNGAGATREQFRVEFGSVDGQGSGSLAETFIVHIPSGRTIWAITDGAAMSDIFLKLGATTYDLI
jgi:Ca2+-binding RTX toxin-like protein